MPCCLPVQRPRGANCCTGAATAQGLGRRRHRRLCHLWRGDTGVSPRCLAGHRRRSAFLQPGKEGEGGKPAVRSPPACHQLRGGRRILPASPCRAAPRVVLVPLASLLLLDGGWRFRYSFVPSPLPRTSSGHVCWAGGAGCAPGHAAAGVHQVSGPGRPKSCRSPAVMGASAVIWILVSFFCAMWDHSTPAGCCVSKAESDPMPERCSA